MQISRHTRVRAARNTARRLGWFSIALGVTELLFTRQVARAAGLQGREGFVRLCGAREIANGVLLLVAREGREAPWIWARVAGDAVDMAAVASGVRKDNPDALNSVAALVALAPVGAVDFRTASALSGAKPATPARSYAGRSGFPRGASESRGIAADVARESLRWMARPGAEVLPATRVRSITSPQASPPAP